MRVISYRTFSCCWFQPWIIESTFSFGSNWKSKFNTHTYKQTKTQQHTHTKMLSLSSRIIKQNKKLSKARLRSCVKFIPRPTGAIPGGGILGKTCARWRHSSHLTGRQDEWSVRCGQTNPRSNPEFWRARIIRMANHYYQPTNQLLPCPHAIKFIRSFVRSFRAENHDVV